MISQENLIEKETIIFKDLSDILGPNVHEQSFVFKGFIFGICTKGYIKLKINYNTHHICQNGIFVMCLLILYILFHINSAFYYDANIAISHLSAVIQKVQKMCRTSYFDKFSFIRFL